MVLPEEIAVALQEANEHLHDYQFTVRSAAATGERFVVVVTPQPAPLEAGPLAESESLAQAAAIAVLREWAALYSAEEEEQRAARGREPFPFRPVPESPFRFCREMDYDGRLEVIADALVQPTYCFYDHPAVQVWVTPMPLRGSGEGLPGGRHPDWGPTYCLVTVAEGQATIVRRELPRPQAELFVAGLLAQAEDMALRSEGYDPVQLRRPAPLPPTWMALVQRVVWASQSVERGWVGCGWKVEQVNSFSRAVFSPRVGGPYYTLETPRNLWDAPLRRAHWPYFRANLLTIREHTPGIMYRDFAPYQVQEGLRWERRQRDLAAGRDEPEDTINTTFEPLKLELDFAGEGRGLWGEEIRQALTTAPEAVRP